jgi:hypothetical protein
VVTDIPVRQDIRWAHADAGRQEAVIEEAEVVYRPTAVPSYCGDVPGIGQDLEGAWPGLGKALGADKALVQVAHHQDGAIGELGVDLDECNGELTVVEQLLPQTQIW